MPTTSVSLGRNLRLTDISKRNGLKVFIVDFATDQRLIDDSIHRNKGKGYVSTTVHAPMAELSSLPPYSFKPDIAMIRQGGKPQHA